MWGYFNVEYTTSENGDAALTDNQVLGTSLPSVAGEEARKLGLEFGVIGLQDSLLGLAVSFQNCASWMWFKNDKKRKSTFKVSINYGKGHTDCINFISFQVRH